MFIKKSLHVSISCTLPPPTHCDFTHAQDHSALFSRRSFCAQGEEYVTCSYSLQMFECVYVYNMVKEDSQRHKNQNIALNISICAYTSSIHFKTKSSVKKKKSMFVIILGNILRQYKCCYSFHSNKAVLIINGVSLS